MILVTGATGLVGKEVVKQLAEQHIPFRALAHSQKALESLKGRGIETVAGDFNEPESLAAAFKGIERVFLLTPSSRDQLSYEKALVDEGRRAEVRHILKVSAFAADNIHDLPIMVDHFGSEQYLKASGLAYTILRPNNFMQNFERSDAPVIKAQGAIYNSGGDGKISFIDTRDIAAVAITALTSSDHFGHIYDLTGSQALSYGEVAEKFSTHLNKVVQAVNISDEAMGPALIKAGLPDWYAQGLVELYRFYREGKGSLITDHITHITTRPPRTLDNYIADHLQAFV